MAVKIRVPLKPPPPTSRPPLPEMTPVISAVEPAALPLSPTRMLAVPPVMSIGLVKVTILSDIADPKISELPNGTKLLEPQTSSPPSDDEAPSVTVSGAPYAAKPPDPVH